MRDLLAEQLLAIVMNWTPEDVARERPLLQALATYKYDEYQQFSPGMRFVESLACWLNQFTEAKERQAAYDFLKKRLLYFSTSEIQHLVAIAYPDHIRPFLLAKTAKETAGNRWHLGKVATSEAFRILQRQTLFLGLSDGARTDVFRRANPELSHEQVRQSHELAEERVEKLLQKLQRGISDITGHSLENAPQFRAVVLLDDFSASGLSYLRKDAEGKYDGKIWQFLSGLLDKENYLSRLAKTEDVDVAVVLYIATEHALNHLETHIAEICKDRSLRCIVYAVHILKRVKIERGQDPELDAIIDRYYDSDNETDSTWLGGTDLRYGFNACGLPLVLSHNTPNNSIGLLWASGSKMTPLFPRVARHKDKV